MSGITQKSSMVHGLNRFVDDKVDVAEQMLGKSVPCSVVEIDETGTIVTVKFEIESDLFTLPQVKCALATDQYTRPPIQKGDKGYVVASDYYMGGMTGLGGGAATFERQANLATLVFHPVGNVDFSPNDDKDKYLLLGPKGVIVRDENEIGVVIVGPVEGGPKNTAQMPKLIAAANDPEAASKGVPLMGLYHNAGAVRVRIS